MELNDALMNVLAAKQRESGAPPVMSRVSSFQRGGEVDPSPTMMMAPATNDNAELEAAVNALMMAGDTAEDPMEAAKADQMAEAAVIGAQAPMADFAAQLSAAGRGNDTQLAHLRSGEVILPPEMFDDADFEATVESRFNALDLDPERYVVGMGIASLNPITGLEEFGFFKKVGKALKKVAKKIAPVAGPLANFIPGVGPVLAGAIGAATNVAAGKGISGALSGALGGYGAGKALGGIGSLGGASSGSAANFAKSGFLDKIGALRQGIGSLPGEGFFGKVGEFILPGTDDTGLLGNLGRAGSYMLGAPRGSEAELLQQLKMEALKSGDPSQLAAFEGLEGLSPREALKTLQERGVAGASSGNFFSSLISGGGADDKGQFGLVGDILGGGLGGGGGSGLGTMGSLGIAGLLGKLAYDEAKTRRGVPLTPLTQEGATGRYNIEAEIARRMGQPAPNPVEFGLLPRGTIPTLSGGRATPQPAQPIEPVEDSAVMTARDGGSVMAQADKSLQKLRQQSGAAITPQEMAQEVLKIVRANSGSAFTEQEVESVILSLLRRQSGAAITAKEFEQVRDAVQDLLGRKYGGSVMAFKDGGNVDMAEFKRMDGKIAGPGTEISDDIPAMLSDGEFVMTGRAVRGAGAFDMQKSDGGIVTLTPNGAESREKGTNLMYDMMDLFAEYADKPNEKRSAA